MQGLIQDEERECLMKNFLKVNCLVTKEAEMSEIVSDAFNLVVVVIIVVAVVVIAIFSSELLSSLLLLLLVS